jgi:hypothetical protein
VRIVERFGSIEEKEGLVKERDLPEWKQPGLEILNKA